MSWSGTWAATVARAVDIFFATITFNRYDLTISTMAYCAHLVPLAGVGQFFLRAVYRMLEAIKAGHCEAAYMADLARMGASTAFLGEFKRFQK